VGYDVRKQYEEDSDGLGTWLVMCFCVIYCYLAVTLF
jgi:hypothetical protein